MTGDLAEIATVLEMDPAVLYRLRDDGPPLFSRFLPCWFCSQPAHREPPRGSSCPVRIVPAADLLPPGAPAWLVAERGGRP